MVSIRSHFLNKNNGGIHYSDDQGKTWTPTFFYPVFSLANHPYDSGNVTLYAAAPLNTFGSVFRSLDFGYTWHSYSTGISWTGGRLPFYPKLNVGATGLSLSNPTLMKSRAPTNTNFVVLLAALTVNPTNNSDTFSDVFYMDTTVGKWVHVENQPISLDQDQMPKDRCAVLHDPDYDGIAYVAGNAGAVVYRVYYRDNKWEEMWRLDTSDLSTPHVDCRNLAWEPVQGSLLLVSDGGIFVRTGPRARRGGVWKSLSGDAAAIEFYNVGWDNRNNRYVGGAQDNNVLISVVNATGKDPAFAFAGGDGTVVSVDNVNCPARLFGCAQFLGDWSYRSGTGSSAKTSLVPFTQYFKDVTALPFFESWYQVNRLRTDSLLFAVNVTPDGAAGLWQFYPVPDPSSVENEDPTGVYSDFPSRRRLYELASEYGTTRLDELVEMMEMRRSERESETLASLKHHLKRNSAAAASAWPAPTLVAPTPGAMLYVFAAGSNIYDPKTNTVKPDPKYMVAMNNTYFFVRSSTSPSWTVRPLPQRFAQPVDWTNFFDNDLKVGLGPISHGKTVSMALSLKNSNISAVTGWPDSGNNNLNTGAERVWITFDAGVSWVDITGDLIVASTTVSMARPAGLEFIDDIDGNPGTLAVLVGTVHGVYVTFIKNEIVPSTVNWARVGDCTGFPIVLVPSVVYEPYSDTLLAGTMGRGLYTMTNAKANMITIMNQQSKGQCNVPPPPKTSSNAYLLPPQLSC